MESETQCRSSPLKTGAERATAQPPEFLISYEEVAIYFSKEEWDLMNQGQKALYKEVMLENYETISSPNIPKPGLISLLEKGQDPFLQDSKEQDGLAGCGEENEYPQQPLVALRKHKHKARRETFWVQKGPERKKAFASQNAERPFLNCRERKERKTCSICAKAFGSTTDLDRHFRTHTGEKPYKCLECGKVFARNHHLERHKSVHTEEKPYKCKECGKTYSIREKLNSHRRCHAEKQYKCAECGKSFNNNGSLKIHHIIHTGEKPFKCIECGRSFRDPGTLTKHELIHSGKQPYSCFQCGRSFSRSGTLNRHLRTHTGEKPYKCVTCGKSFTRKFTVTIHLRTHWKQKAKSKGVTPQVETKS